MDQDRSFLDNFIIVIGALIAFTVAIYFLAVSLEETYLDPENRDNPIAQQAVTDRITPIGQARTSDAPPPAQPEPAAAAAEQPAQETAQAADGKQVYENACFACHGTGAAGAPKLGDVPAWAERIAQGEDVLYKHSIEGFQGNTGVMPAKGGRGDLSDEQVKAAVDYMVEQSQ